MGALVSRSRSATTCARQIGKLTAAGARDRLGRSRRVAGSGGRRLPASRSCSAPTIPGRTSGARRRGVRPGVDGHALRDHRRRHRARQSRARAASCCRCSPIRPMRPATSFSARRPIHGRMLVIDRDNAAEMHRPRLAPARSWSTAAPAAPAAARRWAACAACKHYMQRTAIQSSPAMIAAISAQYIDGAPKHEVVDASVPPAHVATLPSATR